MSFWRGRSRAALALAVRFAGIGLIVMVASGVPVMAATDEVRTDDPRDVGTRIDIKALTHLVDGSAIVYTAETYASFSDEAASFKWGIDRDGDEGFDLIVSTEWREGKLTGRVKDAAGAPVAPAAVTRPGPAAIRVSFPVGVLGKAVAYRYAAAVEVDRAGDNPDDPGERDLVPNSGLIEHRLGAVAPAGARDAGTSGTPPARAEAAAPGRAAAEAPWGAPAPTPHPGVLHAGGQAATPRSAAEAAPEDLPRTGPGNRRLVTWSGAALMFGGALVALGAQRSWAARSEAEVGGGTR